MPDEATAWHVRALHVRLGPGSPQVITNLRRLGEYRVQLGTEQFRGVLAQVAGAEATEAVMVYLDELQAETASEQ